MKIAVIGTGNVGGALGTGWASAGYEVVFGTREPASERARALIAEAPGKISAATSADAVRGADVVVLAVPWPAVPETIATLGPALDGKVLVDCTNPVKQWPEMDHANGAGGLQVARLAPGAKVVKAFNTTGFGNMRDPRYPEGAATMFLAGDDAAAKSVVSELAGDLGFEAMDAGPLARSYELEVLAGLWGALAMQAGLGIAFRVMRR